MGEGGKLDMAVVGIFFFPLHRGRGISHDDRVGDCRVNAANKYNWNYSQWKRREHKIGAVSWHVGGAVVVVIVFAFMIKYCIVLCRMQMGIMGQIHHAAAARGEKGETTSHTEEGEDGSRPTRLRQSGGRPAAAYPGSSTTTRLLLLPYILLILRV